MNGVLTGIGAGALAGFIVLTLITFTEAVISDWCYEDGDDRYYYKNCYTTYRKKPLEIEPSID